MVRRTVNLPERTDKLVREAAHEGESFSATVTRLLELGAKRVGHRRRPGYFGTFDGPSDLGRNAERYLAEILDEL